MGWSIGYDRKWKRDIGYGVPATCDHPGCGVEIDRGLACVCGGQPYGGEEGCGLYFCDAHLHYCAIDWTDDVSEPLCDRCCEGEDPFTPTPDLPRWIEHKLTHESWQKWRDENPDEAARMKETTP